MGIIKAIFKGLGILILCCIVFYVITAARQEKAAKDICAKYPVGADMPDPKIIEKNYATNLMGPKEEKDRPGVQQVFFCAGSTMCDVFCRITYSDGKVLESQYREMKL